jgi:hypothetical protein
VLDDPSASQTPERKAQERKQARVFPVANMGPLIRKLGIPFRNSQDSCSKLYASSQNLAYKQEVGLSTCDRNIPIWPHFLTITVRSSTILRPPAFLHCPFRHCPLVHRPFVHRPFSHPSVCPPSLCPPAPFFTVRLSTVRSTTVLRSRALCPPYHFSPSR